MTNLLKEEHLKIADFTRDTVFPLIDAFTEVHQIRLNVESGLLVFLAQRMVFKGFQPEKVVELVTKATAMTQEKPEKIVAPVATIIAFTPRQVT